MKTKNEKRASQRRGMVAERLGRAAWLGKLKSRAPGGDSSARQARARRCESLSDQAKNRARTPLPAAGCAPACAD